MYHQNAASIFPFFGDQKLNYWTMTFDQMKFIIIWQRSFSIWFFIKESETKNDVEKCQLYMFSILKSRIKHILRRTDLSEFSVRISLFSFFPLRNLEK